jgi:anti-sigma factor RsiW
VTRHPYDDIESFVLGELEPDRAVVVLDHADGCATCAVLLAEAVRGSAALANPLTERPGRASLRSIPRPPAMPRTWPIVGSLAVAACLALLVWNVDLRSNMSALAPAPVAALVNSHFVHHPLVSASGKESAKAIVAADGSWVYVVADQLTPELPYAVWLTANGHSTRLGSFAADDAGEGTAFFRTPASKPQAIVVAPDGEDPAASSAALRWP